MATSIFYRGKDKGRILNIKYLAGFWVCIMKAKGKRRKDERMEAAKLGKM
jgi:hypothetical protein